MEYDKDNVEYRGISKNFAQVLPPMMSPGYKTPSAYRFRALDTFKITSDISSERLSMGAFRRDYCYKIVSIV